MCECVCGVGWGKRGITHKKKEKKKKDLQNSYFPPWGMSQSGPDYGLIESRGSVWVFEVSETEGGTEEVVMIRERGCVCVWVCVCICIDRKSDCQASCVRRSSPMATFASACLCLGICVCLGLGLATLRTDRQTFQRFAHGLGEEKRRKKKELENENMT